MGPIFLVSRRQASDLPAEKLLKEDEADMGLDNPETKTILVADDDHTICKLVSIYLENAGYGVLIAADGAEALSVFEQCPDRIALLLTDVTMPKMDGLQLADAVLTLRPHLPVVFISGNVRNADRGWGCIEKPFRSAELVSKVQQVLASAERLNGSTPAADPPLPLTKREREVLELICEGYSSKVIGLTLGITFKTVLSHRSKIMQKMGVHETVSLVRRAIRVGYIKA